MNATLRCKYNTQRILSPGDLNWVQHLVNWSFSRKTWFKSRQLSDADWDKPDTRFLFLSKVVLMIQQAVNLAKLQVLEISENSSLE